MTLHGTATSLLGLAAALVAATAVPCAPARAQSSPESPEEVAQQFTAALRDTNWVRMAALMHPHARAEFRSLFAPVFQCPGAEGATVRQSLFGTASAADVAKMPDTLLLAAIFRFAASQEEGLSRVLRTAHMRILGHVAEGADTVHVLTRISFSVEGMAVSSIEVASFERFGATWRALLKADFTSMAAVLRNACSSPS